MKLNKAQKEVLLQWVAEGLESDEINRRAAKFKPKFKVLRSQITWYRKTRDVKIEEIKEAGEMDSLKTGLALYQERVTVLQKLANTLIVDLMPANDADNKRWLLMKKTVGMDVFTYHEFNKAEVDALRGVLDDIASEMGQRVKKTDLTTNGKPIGSAGVDLKVLRKQISNEQLAVLEEAAKVIEHAERDSASAEPDGD